MKELPARAIEDGLANRHYSRRSALARLALGGLTLAIPCSRAEVPADKVITFFVVADPQIDLQKWGTAGTEITLKTMNELPGEPFPLGGKVDEPKAVLVAGDLVDDAHDKASWKTYKQFFSPNGQDSLLRFRTFEAMGNHDLSAKESPDGFSPIEREFIERNQSRRGNESFRFDPLHYHYSWDWGPLHLVNLNVFPGNVPRPVYDRPAAWNNPRRSLDFLRNDLKVQVGDSGRPVILMWHYGLRGWGLDKWWTLEDLEHLKAALSPYNVVLLIHGHEHSYARYEWEGYPVFMCPSPQKDRDPLHPEIPSTAKGFLVVRFTGHELQVAHHHAAGWGETWSRPIEPWAQPLSK